MWTINSLLHILSSSNELLEENFDLDLSLEVNG